MDRMRQANPDDLDRLATLLEADDGQSGAAFELNRILTKAGQLGASAQVASLRPLQSWLVDAAADLRGRAESLRADPGSSWDFLGEAYAHSKPPRASYQVGRIVWRLKNNQDYLAVAMGPYQSSLFLRVDDLPVTKPQGRVMPGVDLTDAFNRLPPSAAWALRWGGISASGYSAYKDWSTVVSRGWPWDGFSNNPSQYSHEVSKALFNTSLTAVQIYPHPLTGGAVVVTGVAYGGTWVWDNWDTSKDIAVITGGLLTPGAQDWDSILGAWDNLSDRVPDENKESFGDVVDTIQDVGVIGSGVVNPGPGNWDSIIDSGADLIDLGDDLIDGAGDLFGRLR